MESERDETDQERVRAVGQPKRDDMAFVCVKDQPMTDFVDEPDDESNRIDARPDAEEKRRGVPCKTSAVGRLVPDQRALSLKKSVEYLKKSTSRSKSLIYSYLVYFLRPR
jgi:hypothetical protein